MPNDSSATHPIDTCRDFDSAVEGYRRALGPFMTGDPTPATQFFSSRSDVTLANPLGPPRRGPADVAEGIALAAAQLSGGCVLGFEELSRYSTPDLGYIIQIERAQARLSGSTDMSPIALRVTMIFRREGDVWKVAHRHADPITTPRSIATVIDTKNLA
jgi:ketosteroid isomerase-like protein